MSHLNSSAWPYGTSSSASVSSRSALSPPPLPVPPPATATVLSPLTAASPSTPTDRRTPFDDDQLDEDDDDSMNLPHVVPSSPVPVSFRVQREAFDPSRLAVHVHSPVPSPRSTGSRRASDFDSHPSSARSGYALSARSNYSESRVMPADRPLDSARSHSSRHQRETFDDRRHDRIDADSTVHRPTRVSYEIESDSVDVSANEVEFASRRQRSVKIASSHSRSHDADDRLDHDHNGTPRRSSRHPSGTNTPRRTTSHTVDAYAASERDRVDDRRLEDHRHRPTTAESQQRSFESPHESDAEWSASHQPSPSYSRRDSSSLRGVQVEWSAAASATEAESEIDHDLELDSRIRSHAHSTSARPASTTQPSPRDPFAVTPKFADARRIRSSIPGALSSPASSRSHARSQIDSRTRGRHPPSDSSQSLESRNNDLESLVSSLRLELSSQSSILRLEQSFRAELRSAARARIAELKSTLAEREAHLDHLRARDAARGVEEEAEAAVANSAVNTNQLQAAALHQAHADATRAQQRIAELEHRLDIESARADGVESLLAQHSPLAREADAAATSERVLDLEANNQHLQEAQLELDATVHALRAQLEAQRSSAAELAAECAQSEAQRLEAVSALQISRAALESQGARFDSERAALQQALVELRAADQAARDREEAASARRDQRAHEESRAEAKRFEERLREQALTVHTLQHQVDAQKAEIVSITADASAREQRALADAQQTSAIVRTESASDLASLRSAHATAIANLARDADSNLAQAVETERAKAQRELAEVMRTGRLESEAALDRLRSTHATAMETSRSEAETRLARAIQDARDASAHELASATDSHRSELASLRESHSLARRDLTSSSQQSSLRLEAAALEARVELHASCEKLDIATAKIADLEATSASLQAEVVRAKSEVDRTRVDLASAERKATKRATKLATATERASTLATQLEEVRRELAEQVRAHSAQLETASSSADGHSAQIVSLQAQLAAADQRRVDLNTRHQHSTAALRADHTSREQDLRAQISSLEDDLSGMRRELAARDSAAVSTATQSESESAAVAAMASMGAELSTQIQRCDAAELALRELRSQHRQEVEAMRDAHAKTIDQLHLRIDSLDRDLSDARSQADALVLLERTQSSALVRQLQEEAADKDRTIEQLRAVADAAALTANKIDDATETQAITSDSQRATNATRDRTKTKNEHEVDVSISATDGHQDASDSDLHSRRQSPQPAAHTDNGDHLSTRDDEVTALSARLESALRESESLRSKNHRLERLNVVGIEMLRQEEQKRAALEAQIKEMTDAKGATNSTTPPPLTSHDFPPLPLVAASDSGRDSDADANSALRSPSTVSRDLASLRSQLVSLHRSSTDEVTALRAHIESVTSQHNALVLKWDRLHDRQARLKQQSKEERRAAEEEVRRLRAQVDAFQADASARPPSSQADGSVPSHSALSPDVAYLMQEVAAAHRDNQRLTRTIMELSQGPPTPTPSHASRPGADKSTRLDDAHATTKRE